MSASIRSIALAALLGGFSTNALAQACASADLLTDPAGDYDGLPLPVSAPVAAGLPEHDLLGLSVAQTGTGEDATLTFTLTTAGFSAPALPPAAAWFTSFENADGVIYGVRMQSDGTGAATYFSYRGGENNDGGIDGRFVTAGTEKPALSGSFDPSGVITITIPASAVGMEPGAGIGPFNGGTVQSTPVGLAAAVVDGMPSGDLARDGYFDGCAAKSGKSSAMLATGALPPLSILLLAAGLLARRRR